MTLEEINKWLDNEYGVSYTRLEELHDFYFEKYCDLKQENKQLKDNWNELKEYTQEKYDNPSWASCGARYVLEKMQELEQEAENVSNSK